MDDLEHGLEALGQGSSQLNRRNFLQGVAAVVGAVALAACGGPQTTTPGTPTAKEYKVVLIQGVKGDPFYVTMAKGAQDAVSKINGEGKVKVNLLVDGPASWSAALQTPIVDTYVAQKVDAMIIAACDKDALIEPLKRADAQGIKVISVDTFIGDGDYSAGKVTFPLSYIGSDNEEGGKIAGDALIKAIGGKGKIYIQNVKPGISTTDQREGGCKKAIEATNGAVTLVATDYNNDNAAKAVEQTAAILQRYGDLGGIFGTNLFSAEGAAQAVKNAGKQGKIKIANFDAPEQSIKDLRDGIVDLVIAQKPGEMGSTAVQYALNALQGSTSDIKKRFATGYVVIDKTNVDTPEAQAAIYKGQ